MSKISSNTEPGDFLIELKELALASRLRRLAERLSRDVGRIYQDLQVPFQAKWFSLFYLLSKYSPLSVTDAASRLGMSHATINQLASQMEKAELIQWRKSRTDERRRMLRLSEKGRRQSNKLVPVWEKIRKATRTLLNDADSIFLERLTELERGLDRTDMYERVVASLDTKPSKKIEIVPYRPALKKHFKKINEEWLKKYFVVEEADYRQLNDPNGQIIRKGGQILFAKIDGRIVGACALIRHQNSMLELCKMGVTARAQGLGIGSRLAKEVAILAKNSGAEKLYLYTAPELKSAFKIYKQLGFKKKNTIPLPAHHYQRQTFAMELDLTKLAS